MRHLGRRDQKINGECRILRKLREKMGCTGKYLSGRMLFSFDIDFPDSLLYFKKTLRPDMPKLFRDGVTARQIVLSVRLMSATTRLVSGVKAPLPTFYGSVKGL